MTASVACFGRARLASLALASLLVTASKLYAQTPAPDLDQNWTPDQQNDWYTVSQGSRLVPAEWLKDLEQPNSTGLFLDPNYIASFRYIFNGANSLPIGFAVDAQDDSSLQATKLRWKAGQSSNQPWIGFNCSACHTTLMTYHNTPVRIDGGQTLTDFQGFLGALNLALTNTHNDSAKFDRFASKVLGVNDNPTNHTMLLTALGKLVGYQTQVASMNETRSVYGFGRVDAIGYIFNKVSLTASPINFTNNAPDAPVSYPYLWNTSQQTYIQWDGLTQNMPSKGGVQPFDVGALGRNAGEAIGVFGDIHSANVFGGFSSSVRVDKLVSIEQQLGQLKPPRWPSALFGTPNPALVAEGRTLFADNCASCHEVLKRDDLTTRPIEKLTYLGSAVPAGSTDPYVGTNIGTDPWMACNAILNVAESGTLKGASYNHTTITSPTDGVSFMLGALVTKALENKGLSVAVAGVESWLGIHPPPTPDRNKVFRPNFAEALVAQPPSLPASPLAKCMQEANDPATASKFVYKARPLNGIWATAPYLHNGSVPTLYDLLLPPDKRPTQFGLGSREFDPVKVGYVTQTGGDNSFTFNVKDSQGNIIQGNSNAGHDYGNASFTDDQRKAIVEYLKVIGEDS